MKAFRALEPKMKTRVPQHKRLSEYTYLPLEIFVASLTVLPFFVTAYFYSELPERVPLFLTLSGEVSVWGEKSLLSVFRVPLMALDTQALCLLMKYSSVKSETRVPVEDDAEQAEYRKQYVGLMAGIWDWFRILAAVKMSASSLDTIFLSLERFNYLSRPAFIITAIAALLAIVCALIYGYRLLRLKRKLKVEPPALKTETPVDARRVYGRIFYFNPSDPAVFVSKYIFNFANKWAWVFIACIIAYPLLVFLPA